MLFIFLTLCFRYRRIVAFCQRCQLFIVLGGYGVLSRERFFARAVNFRKGHKRIMVIVIADFLIGNSPFNIRQLFCPAGFYTPAKSDFRLCSLALHGQNPQNRRLAYIYKTGLAKYCMRHDRRVFLCCSI